MLLMNAFLGFFSIFISPHIFLYYKYVNLPYSLILIYGLILSYSFSWLLVITSYYLNLSNIVIYIFICLIFVSSLIYMLTHTSYHKNKFIIIWLITFLLLLPLLKSIGIGFSIWDVLASWNNWAIELFSNEYQPIDAAYPILMPGIWSLIYKIQGTTDIWWTAQTIQFVLPLTVLVLLFSLYSETKNKTYLFISFLIYPYLISSHTINGNMDMPVMLMGTLSLINLYTAEIYKEKKEFTYYIYAALLLAGLASITKQAGLAFLVFNFIYILLNLTQFKLKKILFIVMGISILYLISYLSLYYQNNITNPIGNLSHLNTLAAEKYSHYKLEWLYLKFFDLPEDISFLNFFNLILIILGFSLFTFKGLRKYNSVTFLSALFFIVSILIWVKYFSYDSRNSLWVKAFFILFLSINLNYAVINYIHIYSKLKFIFVAILFSTLLGLYFLGNSFAYTKQKNMQMTVGIKDGCLPSILSAKKLLKDKDSCVKIYTNELVIPRNYRLKNYTDKFILMGRDYKFQSFKYLEHNCSSGRYIIFRQKSERRQEWWKVAKLSYNNLIQYLPNENSLVFFVPPNIKIPKDFFTEFSTINLTVQDYRIKYKIETIETRNKNIKIHGWAFFEDSKIDKTVKYILLKSKNNQYIVTTTIINRDDIAQMHKTKDLSKSGFIAKIHKKEDIIKDTYNIYILLDRPDKNPSVIKTNKQIIL